MAFDPIGFYITNPAVSADTPSGSAGLSNTLEMGRKHRFSVDLFFGDSIDENNTISFNVKSTTTPKVEYDEITVHNGQGEIFMPGKQHYPQIDVVFYDVMKQSGQTYDGMIISRILKALPTGFKNETTYGVLSKHKPIKQYRFNMSVNKLDGKGQRYQQFFLKECYITNLDPGDLSYVDNEIVEVTMKIRYNKFYLMQSG